VLKKSHFAMINFMNPQVSDLSFDRKLGFSAASSSDIDGPSMSLPGGRWPGSWLTPWE
jgi:hypothetical protein